jgi:hypothetical protein
LFSQSNPAGFLVPITQSSPVTLIGVVKRTQASKLAAGMDA